MKGLVAKIWSLYCFFSLAIGVLNVSAQDITKSRVAVLATDTKTNIWVSDFPKNTTIVVLDSDLNLLKVTSTNNFGATFMTIPQTLTKEVTVKTLNGEVIATKIPLNKKEETMVVVEVGKTTKA